MNKKLILLLVGLHACAIQAQVRLGAAFGPSFSAKPKNSDTAFLGKSYSNMQLRWGYHKGRLGLIVSGGIISQNPGNDSVTSRLNDLPPLFGGIPVQYTAAGSTVRNTFFTFGPEICFPLGPVKMHVHVSGGMGFIKAKETEVKRFEIPGNQGTTVYSSRLKKNTTGIFKTGVNFHYYFTKQVAVSLYADYTGYTIEYENYDARKSPVTKTLKQHKTLIGTSAGLTYRF